MGIRLYYSDRTERLAEKLAATIRAGAAATDPFLTTTVIIPNKNLEKWLKMEVARHNGIATSLDFPFLESGLWKLLAAFDPRPTDERPALLGSDTGQLLILAELLALGPSDHLLRPFYGYLHDVKDRQPDYYRKAWQLSEKLEKCFREYEYNREEMTDAWLAGKAYYTDGASPSLARMEACQRELYTRLYGPGGRRDRTGGTKGRMLLTLPQYERLVFRAGRKPAAPQDPRPVHIFGLSQISAFHTRLLFEVGKRFDIRLYQLNVCSEFWEDVTTPHEDRYRKFKDIAVREDETGEYLEEHPAENRLLKLWGKPGRENIKLLSDLEEACAGKVEFDSEWTEAAGKEAKKQTVLAAVQDHILHRGCSAPLRVRCGEGEHGKVAQDASIQIAGAPGIYREAETVYNSIVENMRTDPSLNLTDIAVLVPRMQDYKSAITAAFSRTPRLVPFNLSDSTAADDSLYAAALENLLELIEGSFTRREVFSLILNECFLTAMRVSREDALIWLAWADELNIFHSFDAADKERRGFGASGLYTWEQGLRRLRLGRIMETADRVSEARAYKGVVPFADMDSADSRLVGDFSKAVEELAGRILTLAGSERSSAEWAAELGRLLDDFLAVPPDRPEEERVASSLRRTLAGLAACGETLGSAAGMTGFGFPAEYLRARLAKIATGRGRYLSGGVTISSLLPMRPVPFRIVYIMGLGEGEFPGREERSTIDLRHYRRRIGDVSTPEANRYLFLETLMSVRDKLYLTYVSRDTRKDEAFAPCSVVNELRGYLDEAVLREPFRTLADAFGWPDDMPLTGSSRRYLVDTRRVASWSDMLTNPSLADRLGCLIALRDIDGVKPSAKDAAAIRTMLRRLTGWERIPDGERRAAAPAAVERVTVRELARFLGDPVEASLRRHLGISDERDEDLLAVEDEPFYAASSEARTITGRLLGELVSVWRDDETARSDPAAFLARRLADHYRISQLEGKVPEAAFGGVDRAKLEEALCDSVLGDAGIAAFLAARTRQRFYRSCVIGKASDTSGVELRQEALTLSVPLAGGAVRPVMVTGRCDLLWVDEMGACDTLIFAGKKPSGKGLPVRAVLRPVLMYLALRAADHSGVPVRSLAVHVASPGGVVSQWRYAVSPSAARKYLTHLVRDLLDDRLFDRLPLDLVSKPEMRLATLADRPTAKDRDEYRARLQSLVDAADEDTFGAYRPRGVVRAIDVAVPDDAHEKVLRRLKWLYDANSHT